MSIKRSGFTLVELLVVIAVIAILVLMLLPAINAAREAARRAQCTNKIRQIGLALNNVHEAQGAFPSGWIGNDPTTGQANVEGEPGWGWATSTLEFLEETSTHQDISYLKPITAAENDQPRTQVLSVFRCPSEIGADTFELESESNPGTVLAELSASNYVGMFGTEELHACEGLPVGQQCEGDGVLFHNSRVRVRHITDGLSKTILVGERSSKLGNSTWLGVVPDGEETFARVLGVADHAPNHDFGHLEDFRSDHTGGVNFVFCDNSVRFITDNVDEAVYRGLATRAGGEAGWVDD